MPRRSNVFAPVVAAGLLLVLSGYVAIRLGVAGDRFMPSLNIERPVLSQEPPVIASAPPRLTRRVVIVILDGLRHSDSYGLPYLDSLRRQGTDASATSHYPTFSRPNYVTIVTGVPPQWSGVRTNQYNAPSFIDSIMDRTAAGGLTSGYVSNNSPALPVMFTRPAADQESKSRRPGFESAFDDMHYVQWPGGFVNASRLLVRSDHALLVMLHGATDEIGHEYGADSDEYRQAAVRADEDLGLALEGLDLSRDTVIVVADHGHTDSGGHGGTEPEAIEVPLVMVGAGIRPGAIVANPSLVDIAPTAAALLGLPAPGHALGRTLREALAIDEQARQALLEADEMRVVRNEMLISAALESARRSSTRRTLWRLPFLLGLCVALVFVLLAARRYGAMRADWRVITIAVPAFPITYYAALGVFGQQFSPSLIPERGDMVTVLLKFGLVSTVAHVLAAWFALRGRVVLRDRLAAANALTVWGLFISLLPAGLFWAFFAGPHIELPSPSQMVLIPATLIAVACFALASAVTLALEIVIFFARAVDPRVRIRRLERAAERERDRLKQESGADE